MSKPPSYRVKKPIVLSPLQVERLSSRTGGVTGVLVQYPGYEIYYTTPITNHHVAEWEHALHLGSFSGGLASSFAIDRLIKEERRENVCIWYADTLVESEGLYAHIHNMMRRWGGRLYWYTDGRKPLEIAEEHQIIPNDLMAPCSYELKIRACRQFMAHMPRVRTVTIGLGPDEPDRLVKTRNSYLRHMPDVEVWYPLCWEPTLPCKDKTLQRLCREEWGFEPSETYALGFEHDNCFAMGGCIKAGIGSCLLQWEVNPVNARAKSGWEDQMRLNPKLAGYAFNKRTSHGETQPITQKQIREQYYFDQAGRLKRRVPGGE